MPSQSTEVIESGAKRLSWYPAADFLRMAEYLASEPAPSFSFLSDITTVDRFPLSSPRFEVNYHLLSLDRNERLRLKVGCRAPTVVHSVTSVGPPPTGTSARITILWIRFKGHPDLRRIYAR